MTTNINVIGNIYYNLQKAIDSGYSLISLQGGSRSGKTYNTLIYLILWCLNHPFVETEKPTDKGMVKHRESSLVNVVRKTLPDLRRTTVRDFISIMSDMGIYEDRRFNKTEFTYTFQNGVLLSFVGLDDEQKAKGLKSHILFCNEADELDFSVFAQLRRRTTLFTIIDYNPSFSDEHWICRINENPHTYFFKSTYLDNPFLPQTIIDELESMKTLNPAYWTIYGLGEHAIIDGLVFPKENWDIIEDDEFPEWADDGFIGLDWGWSPDPTVAVHVIIEGNDVYVRELFRENELLAEDIADRLEKWSHVQKYCDIDKRLVAELSRAGIPLLTMTEKDRSTILSGIRILNQRKIHITSSSTSLIKEFKNYVYKKDKNGEVMINVNPVGKFDHGIDALRYVILAEFDNEINPEKQEQLTKYDLGFPI